MDGDFWLWGRVNTINNFRSGLLLTDFHRASGLKGGRSASEVWRRLFCRRSESPLPADSVEKQRVAGAESGVSNGARAPFCSGFARLLRCRKDLGQFTEVLGGGGEEEFVVCAAWTA